MGLIGEPIALGDIANAEAFVQRELNKSGIPFSIEEREELLAEGLAILLELHSKYRPLAARPGIDAQAGRFSGYASMFLGRRLGDAWHKSHPEHRYITDPETGKRRWTYGKPMVSFDGLVGSAEGGDHHLRNAVRLGDFIATRIATSLAAGH